jgi:hypothetical protein
MTTPLVIDDIRSDDGLEPSLPAEGREDGSTQRAISQFVSPDSPVLVAVWSAEPGVFSHPGGPGGETFIVATGSGGSSLTDWVSTSLPQPGYRSCRRAPSPP